MIFFHVTDPHCDVSGNMTVIIIAELCTNIVRTPKCNIYVLFVCHVKMLYIVIILLKE